MQVGLATCIHLSGPFQLERHNCVPSSWEDYAAWTPEWSSCAVGGVPFESCDFGISLNRVDRHDISGPASLIVVNSILTSIEDSHSRQKAHFIMMLSDEQRQLDNLFWAKSFGCVVV